MTTSTTSTVPAWRLFEARVSRLERLSPSFVRVTFTGPDLLDLGDDGLDQRIKVVLPAPDGTLDVRFDHTWYADLAAREHDHRCPVRTYTSRAIRADAHELDVDFVLHGDDGPASRWVADARVGEPVVICGPNREHGGPYRGTGFKPAPGTARFLLAADETAVPAALAILESLPAAATGVALLEVPSSQDALPVAAPEGVDVRWLGRDGAEHGTLLTPAVHSLLDAWLGRSAVENPTAELADDPDGYLWEVPEEAAIGDFYAWLAGDAGVVTGQRRAMVRDRGIDRRSVAFMGYWRRGKAEN